jgi:hypothetical protein
MDEYNNTNDISNIIGMSGLLNNSEIDNSIKPKNIEKELIQNTLELDTFKNDELLNYNPINEYNSVFESLLENSNNSYNNTVDNNNDNDNDDNESTSDNNSNNTDDINNNLQIDNEDSEIDNLISFSQNNNNLYNNDKNSFAYKLTEEQQNQNFVDKVLNNNNSNNNYNYNYNIEDENREDLKLTLLEKIDNLTEELEDDGLSLDKIPKVDYNSNLEQIEYVAKLLMLKANRNRYASLGEEFILALASGLELLCNGERQFLGIKPDLQGYSDVVKVKLRRLRNETSQVVGNVVEKYEISPITTLLIELIPSLFLHSKRRKSQSYDNLYNDLSDDINEIQRFNN